VLPEAYYLAGIALHALVSILVCLLVLRVTGNTLAGWTAGLFFGAYERHQEAVMWISAVNETILALNCILFLLLWDYGISREKPRRFASLLAFVVFALALFSKEAAIAMAPMAVLALARHGYSVQQIIERSIPALALAITFALLWLSQADRNFFVTDGHYALSFHFFPVYGRAVLRLLSPAIPFIVASLVLFRRDAEVTKGNSPGVVFFALFLLLALVPYSFLTYQDHLPSRHTYLASAGLAGLIGILFAAIHTRLRSQRFKQTCTAAFAVLLMANVTYVWLKKDPQFRERAAPTRELFHVLNSGEAQGRLTKPVHVCGFPLDQPWWLADAIARFTSLSREDVVLRENCNDTELSNALIWDSRTATYVSRATTMNLADGK
jgi:hypothetical protein